MQFQLSPLQQFAGIMVSIGQTDCRFADCNGEFWAEGQDRCWTALEVYEHWQWFLKQLGGPLGFGCTVVNLGTISHPVR